MEKQDIKLSLRVLNSDKLESGKAASSLFDFQGGTVGSEEHHHWSIQDQMGNISPTHFAVDWRDGTYCLRVLGEPVAVNYSEVTASSPAVRLQQGDEIVVGNLVLKSYVGSSSAEWRDPLTIPPESLVSNESNPLDTLMEEGRAMGKINQQDFQLADTVAHGFSDDPLKVLENESLTTLAEPMLTLNEASHTLQDKNYPPLFASPLSDTAKDSLMDQDFIDLPSITSQFSTQDGYQDSQEHSLERGNREEYDFVNSDMQQQHLAITPLMRGLSSQLPIHNSLEAHDFLEEVGKTLRAALEGLLALQSTQHGLSDKHLRPIEDNPLRLNLDYGETLSVLFSDQKSPVHLSAPAAVTESLHNIRLHYQANQQAISQALEVMLTAFSPEYLLQRFTHYRRSNERGEMDPAWAWEMYKSYYQELSSSRQQGFEKLFGEVYAQVYDRALRQGLKDSES